MEDEVFYKDNASASTDTMGTQGSSEDNVGEEESDDDIDKMLSELQGFQEELEQEKENSEVMTSDDLPSKPLDQFRFSMAAMEDSGEIDLDALLEDLCSMERDINSGSGNTEPEDTTVSMMLSNGVTLPVNPNSPLAPNIKHFTFDIPVEKQDQDVSQDVLNRLENVQEETKELTAEEQHEKMKAEKIRIALDKMKQARVKKLVIKVYNDEDPTSKTLAIDQTWSAWEVCKKMMRKDDKEPDPYWVLVERLADLGVERMLEDHESVVEVVSNWPWDSSNKLVITNRREKYALFRNPQLYLLSSDTSTGAAQLAEKSKGILIEEYCKKDAMRLPELDGLLWVKAGRKTWRKHYFALRASGIYFNPKGKTKTSKDLVCLIKFEHVFVFTALGFRKKHKAPTDYCLILKHPQYHEIDSKAVKCLCAEDQKTLMRWVVGIRLAKYGYKMIEDYNQTQEEIDKMAFTLDRSQFPRSSSFTNGENTETVAPPVLEVAPKKEPVKDYKKIARMQSQKLRQSAGIMPRPSSTFSAGSNKRSKPKNIGNLFSDAWKKGTEVEAKETEHELPPTPISPQTPLSPPHSISSDGSGYTTPNPLSPKAFHVENIINESDEEQRGLFIKSAPIHRKSFSKSMERNGSRENNKHVYSVVSKPAAEPVTQPQHPPTPPLFDTPELSTSNQPMTFDDGPPPLPIKENIPVAPPPPPMAVDKPNQIPPPPPPAIHKPNQGGIPVAPPPPPVAVDKPNQIPPPPPLAMQSPNQGGIPVAPPPPPMAVDKPNQTPPPPPLAMHKPNQGNIPVALPPPPMAAEKVNEIPAPPPLKNTPSIPDTVEPDDDIPPPPPPVMEKPKIRSISHGTKPTDEDIVIPPPPPPVLQKPKLSSSSPPGSVSVPAPSPPPPPPILPVVATSQSPGLIGKIDNAPSQPPPVMRKPKVGSSTSSLSSVDSNARHSPPPVAEKPRSKSRNSSHSPADDVFVPAAPPCAIPPPPAFQTSNSGSTAPPPVAKKPKSRPNCASPLTISNGKNSAAPPPVAAKPRSSSPLHVNQVNNELAPPPPPVPVKPRSKSTVGAQIAPALAPGKPVEIDLDFPPPPSEMILRSLSMSDAKESEGIPRRNSFGKMPPPLPKRDSSLANLRNDKH